MHDAAAVEAPNRKLSPRSLTRLRASLPTLAEASLVIASALLLVLAFPDFELWWLAWIGMVPLLIVVTQTRKTGQAFLLGWLWGVIFFYGTCWWLTYPMIHYAHLAAWLAYPLFLLPILLVGLFPALFCALLARVVARFGPAALLAAPVLWVSLELARYTVTGQLWNAIGYSQAFHPMLIQTARWGGVYAVSFLIIFASTIVATLISRRNRLVSIACLVALIFLILISAGVFSRRSSVSSLISKKNSALVFAIQPNIPMEITGDPKQTNYLLERHFALSRSAVAIWQNIRPPDPTIDSLPRLVIWPESPMNFSYSRDSRLRDVVANFTRANHTSLLLNSLEPAPNGGEHNSAILVNEEGRIVAQYDKIRLMPFGEYVPLPQWLPGASSVRGIVGDFTPGSSYTLMPLGAFRAGVFICIEAAHPGIARSFANEGADVLINISNDGYLGPTPVMRQHLANAIFRAVENDRDLIRVTNSGLSAYIDSNGYFRYAARGFEPGFDSWLVSTKQSETTFYIRHGDVFAYACALITLGVFSATFMSGRRINRRG